MKCEAARGAIKKISHHLPVGEIDVDIRSRAINDSSVRVAGELILNGCTLTKHDLETQLRNSVA